MDVTRAVAAWKKYMSPFYGKAKLVSPAVTNVRPFFPFSLLFPPLAELTLLSLFLLA